jgi:phage-related protein
MTLKPVVWMGSSKAGLLAFPDEARRDAGYQLEKVQRGLDPSDWKALITVSAGVREIRIRDMSNAFRVIYLPTQAEAIYVLHCFQKQAQRTSHRDVQLATRRFKAIPWPGRPK